MLGRAKNVHNIKISMTIVPSLFPQIKYLCESNTIGIYNFVNKGTISLPELLELYSKYKKPIEININTQGESRGNYELLTDKLDVLIKNTSIYDACIKTLSTIY